MMMMIDIIFVINVLKLIFYQVFENRILCRHITFIFFSNDCPTRRNTQMTAYRVYSSDLVIYLASWGKKPPC